MSSVEKARMFANKAHGEQKYGDHPYSYHLEKVVEALRRFQPESYILITAGYLHDTIEDTDVTFQDIFEEFGRNVARLVFAVTNEEGRNRKERAERTYPKMMAAGRDAIAIKLADRIANIEHSLEHNHGMFKMYRKEYPKFRKALKLPGELKEMWAHLDVLMATQIED